MDINGLYYNYIDCVKNNIHTYIYIAIIDS